MKVYFCNSLLDSCWYVRCLVPMGVIGADGDKTSLRSAPIEPEQRSQAVLDADVVVFHRPNDDRSLKIAKILRKQGKKIVMDNDDTYKNVDGKKWVEILKKVDFHLDEFGKFADLITCSTEFLAQEYRKLNNNVVVLPNCIDPEAWDEPIKNDTDKVRIGFVGSVTTSNDYASIKDILPILSARSDVQLVVFGLPVQNDTTKLVVQERYAEEYAFWHSLNIEWHPLVNMKDYIDTLTSLKLDMMVIPRKDDYFNRAKSNLKFLEASMLEIPVIAQGFSDNLSPYQVNPKDSEHMVIITDNKDWLSAIETMINDKDGRERMGKEAHDYVLENYDINKKGDLWTKAYSSLL